MTIEDDFFKLLKYSNELKRNKKYLQKEDPKAFDTLLNFLVKIEDNIHYSEKIKYIELAKDFLADEVTAEDFSYAFIFIYEGVGKNLGNLKNQESKELMNFLKPSRPELGDLLARTYGACDAFSTDREIALSDEKELQECARTLLLKLQEE